MDKRFKQFLLICERTLFNFQPEIGERQIFAIGGGARDERSDQRNDRRNDRQHPPMHHNIAASTASSRRFFCGLAPK
jgi:hypothetical protein